MNGVGWCWLAVVAAALVGTARGEDPSPGDANEGRGEAPSLLAASELTRVNGAPFVWPALDAAPYAEAGPFREAVAAWRAQAARPARSLPPARSPAALYLAADFAYLAAATGSGDYLAAVTGYERALREAPEFPDAARGRFMLGQANLLLGFGPEAGAAFADLVRHDPKSPLVGDARLGEVAALRLRRRPTEARHLLDAVLAEASGALLCRARGEEVAEARAAGVPAETVAAYRRLAAACPDALDDPVTRGAYAEVLAAAGDRDAARAVLAAVPAPGDARLDLLAGRLAADAGDVEVARSAYERVLGRRAPDAVVTEAKMRLALLDAAGDPARATAALLGLAGEARTPALRAALLGTAADTAARAGRFEEALGLLGRAATLGPEGAAQADGRRAEILGRWVAALGGADDAAGVAAVYAAYATDIDAAAAPEDALAIARALGRLGLHPSAVRLLELVGERGASLPELEVTLADERLEAGDVAAARTAASRLLAGRLPAELLPRARGVAARAALAAGDVAAAAELASGTMDAGLEADVGRALVAGGNPAAACALIAPAAVDAQAPTRVLLVAGAAAAAEGAWDAASEAYSRALRAGGGAERVEAAAGLARLALARGDRAGARSALAHARDLEDALVRRAASAADRSLAVP